MAQIGGVRSMGASSGLKEPPASPKAKAHPGLGLPNNRHSRRHAAHSMKVACVLQWTVEEGPWAVVVTKLGETTISLRVRQAFTPGVHLALPLPDQNGELKAKLLRITRCEETAPGAEWTLDGSFLKALAPEAVALAQARIGTAGCKAFSRLVKVQEDGPWMVTLHDVSHRGIGVLADRPFDRGMYLKLEIPNARLKQLKGKVVRVMHSARQASREEWVVGGTFLRHISDEDLRSCCEETFQDCL